MKITVKKDWAEYLNRFVSTELSRWNLNGVFFDPEENAICATDGLRLGYFKDAFTADSEMPKDGYIIKFEKGFFGKVKNFSDLELSIEGSRVFVAGFYAGEVIDGTFPTWRNVLPKDSPEATQQIGFNPYLLKEFAIDKKHAACRLVFHGEMSAVEVFTAVYPEFCGLIMPCRVANYGAE